MPDTEEKPVANGLIALIAVAVVVGLLAGISVLIGTKLIGLDGNSASSDETAGGASLIMPEPSETTEQDGPLVTLAPSGEKSSKEDKKPDKSDEKKSEKPKKDQITLSPGATQVSPGEELYLSGVYPNGEGAVLDIEIRLDGQDWQDFPVDVSVSGSTFTTYVITSQVGKIQWRVVDKDRKLKSNAVTVTYA